MAPAEAIAAKRGRLILVLGLVVVLLAGVGYTAVSRAPTGLVAKGPTSVSGTGASAVFRIADRTVRQVRYQDRGTLRYAFVLVNQQPLPLTVTGLSRDQRDARLFGFRGLSADDGKARFTVPAGGERRVQLVLHMSGCESLSARAGSFVHDIALETERFGVPTGTAVLTLPEELHTGSPREAFCPDSTATSRPPG